MSSRYGGGDYPRTERWDRSRFEAATRGPPVVERERYEEVDYYAPRPAPERAPRPAVYKEEERYDYRPRAQPPPRWYEEERDPYEGAMVHRPREPEREIEVDIRRREVDRYEEPRPRFVRRQSSLDTFDRRPMARYGDRVKEETVLIPSAPRRRSPPLYHPPPRAEERDYYDEIRVAEPEFYGDEVYRGYREREISRVRRNKHHPEEVEKEEEVVEEEEEVVEKEFPRRGKTRMPMRMVNKKAVIELGYPFEEDGETLVILKALGKEHIDEVITLSREMNNAAPALEEKRTTYVFERTSPSPPPHGEGKVIERRTEIIREGSPPSSEVPRSVREWDQMSVKKSHKSKSRRSSSSSSSSDGGKTATTHRSHLSSRHGRHSSHHRARSVGNSSRHEIILTEERDESATVHGGVGALVIKPERERRSSRSIHKEIKALEEERRMLRVERDTDLVRVPRGDEIIIARERDDTVEIRKDKKAPDPRIIRAMLATLT